MLTSESTVLRRVILILPLLLLPPAHAADLAQQSLPQNATLLFQGDSITDGNRGRTADPNHILGHGYVFILAAKYASSFPDQHVTFLNRGISGNTVADLQKRWKNDTLDLKPDVLSILIGVNDLSKNVSPDDYERQYDALLQQTTKALPHVQLILGTPFGLPTGKLKENWEPRLAELNKRIAIVTKLAERHHAILVNYQAVFEEAVKRASAEQWIWDGVHPTYAGHQIMADAFAAALNAAHGQR